MTILIPFCLITMGIFGIYGQRNILGMALCAQLLGAGFSLAYAAVGNKSDNSLDAYATAFILILTFLGPSVLIFAFAVRAYFLTNTVEPESENPPNG